MRMHRHHTVEALWVPGLSAVHMILCKQGDRQRWTGSVGGGEEQEIFFWKKKKISSQSEARVIGRADRLSMCVLYTGPKRFQRLNQMLCLLSLFPLSNFTFAIEKEIYLSLPDNTEIYELSSPTEKGGTPTRRPLSAVPSAPPGDTWIF